MITFIDLYPGSNFGFCPKCKCTCEPELFLESDGASRLVCPRCLNASSSSTNLEIVDDDEEAEDEYDKESLAAYDRWWRGGGVSAGPGFRVCNAHDCRVHTGGRCYVCQQPSCQEHISTYGRCPDCEHVSQLLN